MIKKVFRKIKGLFSNRVVKKGNGNIVSFDKSLARKTQINVLGNNNVISVAKGSKLSASSIKILGSNNRVELLGGVSAKGLDIHVEDDNNHVVIGENTYFSGKIHLACIEGTNITIGKDCLFSSDIVVRTGDSHSLLDMAGERINPSKDVVIGNHVWVGNKVIINKGAKVSDNSVVGTGAILTKQFTENNVVIAGVPAKVVKNDVNWCSKRI